MKLRIVVSLLSFFGVILGPTLASYSPQDIEFIRRALGNSSRAASRVAAGIGRSLGPQWASETEKIFSTHIIQNLRDAVRNTAEAVAGKVEAVRETAQNLLPQPPTPQGDTSRSRFSLIPSSFRSAISFIG